MKKMVLIAVFLCSCSCVFAANQESYSAPSQLPNVKSQMLTAGFWISKHPSVDQIVMNEEQIRAFNDNIRNNLKLTKDIFSLVENFKTESLMDVFKKNLEDYAEGGYYTIDGTRNDAAFMEKVKTSMHLSGLVLGVAPRYGIIIHRADQRFLPTAQGLFAQRGDVDFDELQNSALDIGTPVAVIHKSQDGKWSYVLSELSDGWVKTQNIAFGDSKVIKNFLGQEKFVVITSPKADIFLNDAMTEFYDETRMGVTLPLLEESEKHWIVELPLKDKQGQLQMGIAFIPKSMAHRGYLPYTARSIYNQAFLMLDKPYGWGDMNGQQDCSRFLQMIYATAGIHLPRDSKDQAQVGEPLSSFDGKTQDKAKLEFFKNIPGATSVLTLKGHILLYLGMIEGTPYAIHETSGYSQTKDDRQIKYVLNRVIVSDLSLGEGSTKGSLLRRLLKIVGIQSSAH